MKIGTLNMHDAQNFGALLVSYSLRRYIKNLGYDCFCIDYQSPLRKNIYPAPSKELQSWRETHLGHFGAETDEYDVIVYGSDAIWKAYDCDVDETYFGSSFLTAKKKITYSASYIENHWNYVKPAIGRNLKAFDAISVRESILKERLQEFTDKTIAHTCDPAFFLNAEQWGEIASHRIIEQKYAVFYNQQINEVSAQQICNTLSQIVNLPFYVFSSNSCTLFDMQGKEVKNNLTPSDFISLYKYADFVCAGSYHGLVFSLIFEKPFVALHPFNSERTDALLNLIGLRERRIEHSSQFADIGQEVNYQPIRENLEHHIKQSKDYLRIALSG